jgi:GTPase SAR1 family protein
MEAATDVVVKNSFGPPRRELLFKILVIGELGSGKTSFIKRYVHQERSGLEIFYL